MVFGGDDHHLLFEDGDDLEVFVVNRKREECQVDFVASKESEDGLVAPGDDLDVDALVFLVVVAESLGGARAGRRSCRRRW